MRNQAGAGWLLLAGVLLMSPESVSATQVTKVLPAGSKVYLSLDAEVTSKRGESDVGQVVPCRVWREVEDGGIVFIKAGTPATCKIDKIKRRNMGGIEGKISVAGLDTRSVDDQLVTLQGGYNKEGSGRKAVVWTVGLLLLWPVLFVPGGSADLPPGTVFDTSTVNPLHISVESSSAPVAKVNLAGLLGGFSAEFMLDEFLNTKKPDTFKVKLTKAGQWPATFYVDNVDDKPIDRIPVTVTGVTTEGDVTTATGLVDVKTLAKHFTKGINRFQVAFDEDGNRTGAEVIMDVQM